MNRSGERRCNKMKVESIDFLKAYNKAEHYLQTLVRIVDSCSDPIEHARVRIRIQDPDGASISLSALTDREGLAAVELSGILAGTWEVDIAEVSHPDYTLSLKNSLAPTRSTYM